MARNQHSEISPLVAAADKALNDYNALKDHAENPGLYYGRWKAEQALWAVINADETSDELRRVAHQRLRDLLNDD